MKPNLLAAKMLLSTLPSGITDRAALLLQRVNCSDKYAYRIITRLISSGCLAEGVRVVRDRGHAFSVSFLSLTANGFAYLATCLSDPAVGSALADAFRGEAALQSLAAAATLAYDLYGSDDILGTRLSNDSIKNLVLRKRQEAVCEAAGVMAFPLATPSLPSLFGSDVILDAPDGEADADTDAASEGMLGTTTAARVLETALELHKKELQQQKNEISLETASTDCPRYDLANGPVFLGLPQLRKIYHPDIWRQYIFSAHNGIILTAEKAYLTYHTDYRGTAWSLAGTGRVIAGLSTNLRMAGMDLDMRTAILFCSNFNQFKHAILDTEGKRRRGKQGKPFAELGDGLRELYIVPETLGGIVLLSTILQQRAPQETVNEFVLAKLPHLKPCSDARFSLQTETGKRCFNGLLMESKRINRLLKAWNKHNRDFAIVCFEWEQQYYLSVFPGVEIITL